MHSHRLILLAGTLVAGACGQQDRPPQQAQAAGDTAGMQMPAMAMPSLDLLPEMRARLDSVINAAPQDLPSMVSPHAAATRQMLQAMDSDMRGMGMSPDAAWRALSDSVRSDVDALARLRGEALILRMRAHVGRMRRLLEVHERMMKM